MGLKSVCKILEDKEEIFTKVIFLQNLKSRYVAMNTQQYSMLLSASYHPSVMRDGAERETLFYSLWKGRNGTEQEIVEREIQDLLNGNIPYFSCSVCGKHLIHNGKEISKEYFLKTAWEVFIEKIKKNECFRYERTKRIYSNGNYTFFQETDAIMKIMSIL